MVQREINRSSTSTVVLLVIRLHVSPRVISERNVLDIPQSNFHEAYRDPSVDDILESFPRKTVSGALTH